MKATVITTLKRLPPWRSWAGSLLLSAAVVGFAAFLDRFQPLGTWLFFHYLGYWVAASAFVVAGFGVGHVALTRLLRLQLRSDEHVAVALALGLLAQGWLVFVLGVAQLLRAPTFYLLPGVLLCVTSVSVARWASRRWKRLTRLPPKRLSLGAMLALGLGCVALGLVYFAILSPENIQFDARWKHLALAEDLVAHGGLRRSVEGWMFAARPQLASYLYAWAFLVPGARAFDQLELAAHVEFIYFALTTVVAMPALLRRLVPRIDARWVWASRFLFPGVFVYDSSVTLGADHLAATFAPAIALVMLALVRRFDRQRLCLLALLIAGPLLVKETAAILLIPFPLLVAALLWFRRIWQSRRAAQAHEDRRASGWLAAPLWAVLVVLVATSPYWLKNWVLYGNPVYPSLPGWFPSHPWSPVAAYKLAHGYAAAQMWAPSHDWKGVLDSLRATLDFTFVPNDWAAFHGKRPVFGSLLTLLLPALLLLRRTRAIWLLVAYVHVGVFGWFWVHHQDRYLQAALPLHAAAVAAILLLLWRQHGWLVRAPLVALITLQTVWGADTYFYATHGMARDIVAKVTTLLGAGYRGRYEERLVANDAYGQLRSKLPKGARVLYHQQHLHLGAGAESVLDSQLWQYGIDYGSTGNPEGMRRLLNQLGVTHIHYARDKSIGVDSLAGDFLFFDFVERRSGPGQRVGGYRLVTVPTTPRPAFASDLVFVRSCGAAMSTGLYHLNQLQVPSYGPAARRWPQPVQRVSSELSESSLLAQAQFAALDGHCRDTDTRLTREGFELLAHRDAFQKSHAFTLWERRERQH